MANVLSISPIEILHEVKLSCQIPAITRGILSRKIITHTAQEKGLEVDPTDLQQTADSLRLMNKLQSADETWTWLQKHNLSLDEFEEMVHATVISSKLAQHLFADRVESFFVEQQLDYTQVVIYETVLDDEDQALELYYSLLEGETSFPEVAHQYIQDTELRRAGGYCGKRSRLELSPEISAAVFSATPPQILKPILTASGAHLILVEEFIQPQLDDRLRMEITSSLFSEWLNQQLNQFEIELDMDLQVWLTTSDRF